MENPNNDARLNGWLLTPATNLVEFVSKETIICGLTQSALVSASVMPTILSAAEPRLAALNPSGLAALRSAVEHSTTVAEFAREEVEGGYSTILSHHAVAMWAAIETATEQTILNLIRKVPDAHDVIIKASPSLNAEKVKTKTASDAEKALNMWKSAFKMHSFDRELVMLGAFGVKVELSASHHRALVEMSEVRNLLLHKGGFVDEKLLSKAPWLPFKAGQQMKISQDRMAAYVDAAHVFAMALISAAAQSAHIVIASKKP